MRILLSSIILFSSTFLHAETLLELYKLAEEQNPQLKIANTNRLIILEKKPQLRATMLPQVTVGANASEASRKKGWLLSSDRVENTTAGYHISLAYSLYHPDRDIALEQVDNQIKITELTYESSRQSLMEQVATRYFAVLAGTDNLKLAKGAKEAFGRQLDQAKQRFQVGLIAITDVQEAQAGYDLAVADEIAAQNGLDNAREMLRELTGSYHETLASLSEDAPLLGPDPPQIEAWSKMALEQNPQLLASRYQVEIAHQEIDKQRATHSPTVEFVAGHSYNDILRGQDAPGNLSTSNSFGIQLNYRLYEGGAIDSQVREAQQQYTQAIDKVDQERRTVQRQTHGAFLNLSSNISRIKALRQALASTKTALEAVKTGFEVGTRTTVDVLNAERDLLRAQRDYSNARYDYVLASIRLKQAVGMLSLEDLESLNDWLSALKVELETVPTPPQIVPVPIPSEVPKSSEDSGLKVDVNKEVPREQVSPPTEEQAPVEKVPESMPRKSKKSSRRRGKKE